MLSVAYTYCCYILRTNLFIKIFTNLYLSSKFCLNAFLKAQFVFHLQTFLSEWLPATSCYNICAFKYIEQHYDVNAEKASTISGFMVIYNSKNNIISNSWGKITPLYHVFSRSHRIWVHLKRIVLVNYEAPNKDLANETAT